MIFSLAQFVTVCCLSMFIYSIWCEHWYVQLSNTKHSALVLLTFGYLTIMASEVAAVCNGDIVVQGWSDVWWFRWAAFVILPIIETAIAFLTCFLHALIFPELYVLDDNSDNQDDHEDNENPED